MHYLLAKEPRLDDTPKYMHDHAFLGQMSEEVRRRRKDLGIGQAVLAELASCSIRFVHMVEHGKPSLRLDKLLDVLDALGLELTVRGPGSPSAARRGSGRSGPS